MVQPKIYVPSLILYELFFCYLYSAVQCSLDILVEGMHAVAVYTQVQVENNQAVGGIVQVLKVAVLNNHAVLGK